MNAYILVLVALMANGCSPTNTVDKNQQVIELLQQRTFDRALLPNCPDCRECKECQKCKELSDESCSSLYLEMKKRCGKYTVLDEDEKDEMCPISVD